MGRTPDILNGRLDRSYLTKAFTVYNLPPFLHFVVYIESNACKHNALLNNQK